MMLGELLDQARASRGAAIMGILNVTPDSFSDGGKYYGDDQVKARIDELLADGSDILDIGGESTRPGAQRVSVEEQLRRILPAIRYAVAKNAVVSVDTTEPEVARVSLSEGAKIINDVSCLEDPRLAQVTAQFDAHLVLMHSHGSLAQQRMQGFSAYSESAYGDVVQEVRDQWAEAKGRAIEEGLDPSQIWFDPGLGFAKNARHSWEILTRLTEFSTLGAPIVIGPSRKSFLAALDGAAPSERLGATIASVLWGASRGAAVVRVHDVAPVRQALAAWHHLDPGSGGARAR